MSNCLIFLWVSILFRAYLTIVESNNGFIKNKIPLVNKAL